MRRRPRSPGSGPPPGSVTPAGSDLPPEPLVRDDTQRSSSRPGPRRTALVVLPLLCGLAVAGAMGGRMLMEEGGEPASTSGTVTCWDASEADSVQECSRPRGVDGLAWVFPSFRPAELDCRDELERNPSFNRPAMWSCDQSIRGRAVTLTYSQVSARKPALRYFDDLHGQDARGEVRELPGGATAFRWAPRPTDDGAWEASVLLREGPFAVTVRTERRGDADRALRRRVDVRPPGEWRGVPAEDS